jgi:hypothetical protein
MVVRRTTFVEKDRSLIFLAFIVPVAIYCFFLAFINRKPHPVVIAGPWDFAAVLFALSGLLICGGPAILSELYEHAELSSLSGRESLLPFQSLRWEFWLSAWFLYFALVLAGSALLLCSRRRVTSIYNIPHERMLLLLTTALDRSGLSWRKVDDGSVLVSCQDSAGPKPEEEVPLQMEYFRLMQHASLHWPCDAGSLRRRVEPELIKLLAEEYVPLSPISNWLLSAALLLSSTAFLALIGLIIVQVLVVMHH